MAHPYSIFWSWPLSDQNHTPGTKSLFQMQNLKRLYNQPANGSILVSLCQPAHRRTGSYPPTLSIYPLVFCASLQSGGIVGQGHCDNLLVLCRINDRALNYTQLGPASIQQLALLFLSLSLSDGQTLVELVLELRASLDFISLPASSS